MKRDYEYIVLGLGGLGSSAAYWLSRTAGPDVLGVEQFELGHSRGESQDHSRIIRLSYHTPGYVELAKQAYACWAQVEEDGNQPCVLKTGGLDLGPAGAVISLDTYRSSMRAAGVPFEDLDSAEIRYRWPQWSIPESVQGVFQDEGGIVMAARANELHQRLAREHGATLREQAAVSGVRSVGGEVEIIAGGTAYRCRRLVVAAGPWSNTVLEWLGNPLPLEVTQEQVTYYSTPHLREFDPARFPVWIWMDDPCFYGFPVMGEAATKVAQDAGGRAVSPETRTFDPDPDNFARVDAFTRKYLPRAHGPVLYVKTCLYTLTPDRDFVIDQVPGHPEISLAIGAGHAFKFASLIGRILSELAVERRTESDISPFSIERPILREKEPARSYMV